MTLILLLLFRGSENDQKVGLAVAVKKSGHKELEDVLVCPIIVWTMPDPEARTHVGVTGTNDRELGRMNWKGEKANKGCVNEARCYCRDWSLIIQLVKPGETML